MPPPTFVLYVHDYCHLCETRIGQLQPLVDAGRLVLRVVDLDAFPDLQALHSERVPVLTHEDGALICFGQLDRMALARALMR
ncbi:MAG: glutaredoxin family protein [Acidobacteriaceae bacterium]|nr:glutaredoxin family protein [Acidobacteriaceae bacterium]